MFSVHTIQNFPIWNPNVAPKNVTIFGPRDPPLTPWHPPGVRGGQKWPKFIPSSPMMIVNAKKTISGGVKNFDLFFHSECTRGNVKYNWQMIFGRERNWESIRYLRMIGWERYLRRMGWKRYLSRMGFVSFPNPLAPDTCQLGNPTNSCLLSKNKLLLSWREKEFNI